MSVNVGVGVDVGAKVGVGVNVGVDVGVGVDVSVGVGARVGVDVSVGVGEGAIVMVGVDVGVEKALLHQGWLTITITVTRRNMIMPPMMGDALSSRSKLDRVGTLFSFDISTGASWMVG